MEQLGTRPSLMLAPHCGTLVPLAIMSTWSHQGFKQTLKTFLFHVQSLQCFIFIFSKCTVCNVLVFVSFYQCFRICV